MKNDPSSGLSIRLHSESLHLCIEPAEVCLRRINRWHAPPNWSLADWRAEVRSVAMFAAVEAAGVFDAGRGVACETFIRSRVLARTLTFYRHEWAYATRHRGGPSLPGEEDQVASDSSASTVPAIHFSAGESAGDVLAPLPETGRWLLEELYLHERTEADLGRELGITQRAVNKRKHAALVQLRRCLRR